MPDSVFSTPLFASPGRDYRGRYVHPVEDARYAGIELSLGQSGTDNIRNTNLRQACDDASRSCRTSLALTCLCPARASLKTRANGACECVVRRCWDAEYGTAR